ncbi:uncharacterized protein L969DRAFT_42808 [Mixia osmundae IAM 14324]|uniref:Cytidyltransferase-like domain-containing protein n=1 Tax=Mixia osmundae (strain CBS 9802 / IAM 14324 / JCM 22182 / KY 12970) TaxID=764103 RepID=G7E4L1_MIXOS|nr:uncharacterized protein L969DRAFT_42808 [Mixia osmundae IAM 14324]KEI41849.1 hypothetical protein L969DRAFT_42808 [Mixia osmundae IAM 14324]GAA97771.1 hypothetical protein E5Q_04450 [Mixia osmundae IAM 14324]
MRSSSGLNLSSEPAIIRAKAEQVQAALNDTTGAARSEIIWTSHATWPHIDAVEAQELIVLDSSFNPPHRAHLAMLREARTRATKATAYLVLVSTKNADKKPQPGDPTLKQKLEMMIRLCHAFGDRDPIAVGCLAAPTFAEKAGLIDQCLERLHSARLRPRQIYLLGFDTLARFFALRYYDESVDEIGKAMQAYFDLLGARIICARRGNSEPDQEERDLLSKHYVKRWTEKPDQPVAIINFSDRSVVGISSTEIRKAVKDKQSRSHLSTMLTEEVFDYILAEGLYRT